MFELVNYVHDKYKQVDKDFNFNSVAIEDFQVEEFFRVYAEKIGLKDKNVGWHPNVLRHAVHLNVIHIFASNALENIEFDQADDRKLTKCLAKCTSKAKDDRRTNPISKIMTAINEKFPKLSDPILRLVMKKPEMLCRQLMLEKINCGDEDYHKLTLQLIIRVLNDSGNLSLCYERIVEVCFVNATLVTALNERFKKLKKENKVVRLTLEEFYNFINNNSNQIDMKKVYSDVNDVAKPLNIASSIEQTKAKTVVTDA